MKYILLLLISISYAQVPILPIGMGESKIDTFTQEIKFEFEVDDDFVRALNLQYDPEFYNAKCFKAILEFADGWEDIFDVDSICTEIIDVRITVGDKTIDYTAEEFMERLGFIEWLKK